MVLMNTRLAKAMHGRMQELNEGGGGGNNI